MELLEQELELLEQELELLDRGPEAASEEKCDEMFRSSSREFLGACCGRAGAGAGDPRCALQPLLALLRRQEEVQVTTEQSRHEPRGDRDISASTKVLVVVHQTTWAPLLAGLAVFSLVTAVFGGLVCHLMARLDRPASSSKVGCSHPPVSQARPVAIDSQQLARTFLENTRPWVKDSVLAPGPACQDQERARGPGGCRQVTEL